MGTPAQTMARGTVVGCHSVVFGVEKKAQRMDGLLKVIPFEQAKESKGLASEFYIRTRRMYIELARH